MQPLLCKRKPIRKIIPFTKKKVEPSIKKFKISRIYESLLHKRMIIFVSEAKEQRTAQSNKFVSAFFCAIFA